MKKFICLILCLSLLAGCSTTSTNYTTTNTTTTTTETTTLAYTIDRDAIFDSSRKPVFKVYFNSANGIEVTWGSKYLGSKTIKYCTLYLKFTNGVDDPAYDQLTGLDERMVKLTGPIDPGKCVMLFESIVAYGPDISKVQITEIELEYMDGTKDKLWYGWQGTAVYSDYDLSWNDINYLSGE